MKQYVFDQNNSGGTWQLDGDLAHWVIIEAENENIAKDKLEEIGDYFNGVQNGYDCGCCGDRWNSPYELDTTLWEYVKMLSDIYSAESRQKLFTLIDRYGNISKHTMNDLYTKLQREGGHYE